MLVIDGSQGEGGGQILRTALALAMITRKNIVIKNIRAGRKKPGLQPQHLACVNAAVEVCQGKVSGARLGSTEIEFSPGPVSPGRYRFDIHTAGSACLLGQMLSLPLALTDAGSALTIRGGTHVPWSPLYPYLDSQWRPQLADCGIHVRGTLGQAGFYPQGGGQIQLVTRPVSQINPLVKLERGSLRRIRGEAVAAKLDQNIARRMKLHALRTLEDICRDSKITTPVIDSANPGAYIFLIAEFDNGKICASALGERGKRAELVVEEALTELLEGIDSGGSVDRYLADQLLLPLAFAAGPSALKTARITHHLVTNAEIVQKFVPGRIQIEGNVDEAGIVWINGL